MTRGEIMVCLLERDPRMAYIELKCRFMSDEKFRNEVLDAIPKDKMKEMKETYEATTKFKNLTFEEWFDCVRKTGLIIESF